MQLTELQREAQKVLRKSSARELEKLNKAGLTDLCRELSEVLSRINNRILTETEARVRLEIEDTRKELANVRKDRARIAEKVQSLENEVEQLKAHSPNWGGKRKGAGRKSSGVKRFSRVVACSSREAEAYKKYAKAGDETSFESVLRSVKKDEIGDVKKRYLYLSLDEWERVKKIINSRKSR